MPQEPSAATPTPQDSKVLDHKLKLFDALARLWASADNYVWNRAKTIIAVQAGVLAGSFALAKQPSLAALVLICGGVLSTAIYLMVKRDEETRDYYAKFIDPLKSEIFGPPLYPQAMSFRMIPKPSGPLQLRAGLLMEMCFIGLIVLDLLLAAVFLFRGNFLA